MNSFNKLANWYFSKRALPYWCIIVLDSILCFLCGLLTIWIFSSGTWILGNSPSVIQTLALLLLVDLICFRLFHTYDGIIRYSSFADLKRVALAMSAACFIVIIIHYPILYFERGHRPHFFIYPLGCRHILSIYLITTIALSALRVLVKLVYESAFLSDTAQRTFIYGTRSGGVALSKNIKTEKPKRFELAGFIDDGEKQTTKRLTGVKVHALDDQIVSLMVEEHVTALLVSPLKNKVFRENTTFQDKLIEAGIKIYMVPQTQEWNGGDKDVTPHLKEVNVEDLLPRNEIDVDMQAVGEMLTGKSVLITGAAGSIGSEMVRQIAVFKPSLLILVDQAETPQHDLALLMADRWPQQKVKIIVTSICRAERMEKIFATYRPDYVFHAAAYKHVPMMEDNPGESIQNNVIGTKIVADLSVKYHVKKFVMISTDKAVNPANVMGCSKRICEIYVQSLDKAEKDNVVSGGTQFVTTRFGNVLGSNGSVIPIFKEQIRHGGPVTVTHPDVIRYFMLIPEACKLVLEAGTHGHGGEIFVFDMGHPVKIARLAKRMIQLSGAKDIHIVYTGLRPGEKLYEEVLKDSERTKPTIHPKIRIAAVREYDYPTVERQIEQLDALSKEYDDLKTVALMKKMVPEYRSNHSIYEQLDTLAQ